MKKKAAIQINHNVRSGSDFTIGFKKRGTSQRALWSLRGLAFALLSAAASVSLAQVKPFNRIVILLDRSGSFIAHLDDARQIAWKYIQEIANTSPNDDCYVLAVDNDSRVIAYIKGIRSRRSAEQEFDKAFKGGPSAGIGTDYTGAYQLAKFYFSRKPAPAASYLLAFGDHVVDPEKNGHTLIRAFKPLSAFDWSQFKGVSMNLFFVDEGVRRQLDLIQSFSTLGANVYGIETDAKALKLAPPKHLHASEANGGMDWTMIGGVVAICLLGGLSLTLMRPRRKGGNR